jgi:hypothetical protein
MNPRHAEAAEQFHQDNPHIYIALRDLAFKLLVAGHTAWYARQLMANEPELADFFEIRERQPNPTEL